MSRCSILLLSFMIAVSSNAAELCLQGTVSGQKDLATPWPSQVAHSERHTQIQRAISMHKRNAQYCLERFGDLPKAIQFSVSESESIEVEESSVNSETAECIAKMLKKVRVDNYSCDMNVLYKWNGKFPLLNTERVLF